MKKAFLALTLLVLTATASTLTWSYEKIFYGGVGIGRSDLDFSGFDDSDAAWKLFGGWQPTPWFAVEAGWVDLGELRENPGNVLVEFEVDGFAVNAIGRVPVGQGALYGKVGAFSWTADAKACVALVCTNEDHDETDVVWGLGVSFDFNDQVGIRGEFERYDIDGDDIDMLSAAAYLRF